MVVASFMRLFCSLFSLPCPADVPGLPLDVLQHVFRFLDAPSLARASAACKSWRDVALSHSEAWERHFRLALPMVRRSAAAEGLTAESWYQAFCLLARSEQLSLLAPLHLQGSPTHSCPLLVGFCASPSSPYLFCCLLGGSRSSPRTAPFLPPSYYMPLACWPLITSQTSLPSSLLQLTRTSLAEQ